MSNCSVHPDRCIWELTLGGAKEKADTAIRRMWAAESQLHDLRKRYDEMRAEMITALNGALVVLLLGEHVNKEEAVSYLKELTSKYSPRPTGVVKGEKPPEDQY